MAWFRGRLDLSRAAGNDNFHRLLFGHFGCMHVRARKSREVGGEVGGEVRMRIKCGIHKGAPNRFADHNTLDRRTKMAGVFLKLVVFITLSLHYVAAQGTSK